MKRSSLNNVESFRIEKAWHQLPDETDIAYHRFTIYMELGSDRSLEKTRQKLGKSSGYLRQLETWSSKYGWVDRSNAYDFNIAMQRVEDQELIQKKALSKILSRLDETIDKLFEIALSDAPDRMRAIEMLLNLSGIMDLDTMSTSEQLPTYQQINNYFADK